MIYNNFSDDWKNYNGYINIKYIYNSKVILTRSEEGNTDYQLYFDNQNNLLKSETKQYAKYGNEIINSEDYEE